MANGVTRIAEDDARSVPGDASPGRGREQAEGRDVRGEGSGSTADAPAWGRKAVLRGSHAAERDVGRGVDFERVEREDDRWGERGRDVAMSMGRGSVGESLRQSAGRGLGEDDAMVQVSAAPHLTIVSAQVRVSASMSYPERLRRELAPRAILNALCSPCTDFGGTSKVTFRGF